MKLPKIIKIIFATILGLFITNICGYSASASTIPTSVTIKPSLSLIIPTDNITLNLDPTTNPFDSETITISVGTNNATGYWLTMSTTNNDTELVNTVDSTKTIPTLPSTGDDSCLEGCSETDFPVNHWGYKLGTSTNYLPFSSGITINSKSTKVNNDTTNLTLASKVDYLQVSGSYKRTFNFTALPHVTQHYMQDLDNPTIANQVCVKDAPSVVIDKRDEQAYLIQRLDDDKCWMLDNLNLDLTNKDVVDNLTPQNTNADETSLKSLRQGNRTDCGEVDCSRYATSGLTLENWTDRSSNTTPMVNRSGVCDPAINASIPCVAPFQGQSYNTNTIATIDGYKNGKGSYKIGTYYNYCAASAGNYCYNSDAGTGNANADICPASWRLPTGGDGDTADFENLYNLISTKYPSTKDDATSAFSIQSILSTPFAGYYEHNTAYRQGTYGTFWSSTFKEGNTMHVLRAHTLDVEPQAASVRTTGRSVRCLLQEP